MKIDAQRWIEAHGASELERRNIQGFYYGTDKEGYHVIRNLLRKPHEQKVWDMFSTAETYTEVHDAMMRQITLIETQIVCEFYENGWPVAPTPEPQT
jgi:hypothetical protein